MKQLQPLICSIFVSLSVSTGLLAESTQLRVLSYNIHHGEGINRELNLERIAEVILSVNPDLVALQEVDQNVKRTGNVDQPQELARLTKMNVAFGANIKLQGGHYGNAILSRFPINQHQNHLLPNVDNGEQRGVLISEISLPEDASSLQLLATHFDHRPQDQERVQSAKAVNELITLYKQPALLMGDLNDVIGSKTLIRLKSTWQRANDEPLSTVPVSKPSRQIDFIMYRPATSWKVIEIRVLDESIASDHRAIFAVLELLSDEK